MYLPSGSNKVDTVWKPSTRWHTLTHLAKDLRHSKNAARSCSWTCDAFILRFHFGLLGIFIALGCLAKMACLSSSVKWATWALVALTITALALSPAKSLPERSAYIPMCTVAWSYGMDSFWGRRCIIAWQHHTMRMSSDRSFSIITDCIFVPSPVSVVCRKAFSPLPPLVCDHNSYWMAGMYRSRRNRTECDSREVYLTQQGIRNWCVSFVRGDHTCCACRDNNAEPTFCGPALLRALPLCFPIPISSQMQLQQTLGWDKISSAATKFCLTGDGERCSEPRLVPLQRLARDSVSPLWWVDTWIFLGRFLEPFVPFKSSIDVPVSKCQLWWPAGRPCTSSSDVTTARGPARQHDHDVHCVVLSTMARRGTDWESRVRVEARL